jgi:hypothetical protein
MRAPTPDDSTGHEIREADETNTALFKLRGIRAHPAISPAAAEEGKSSEECHNHASYVPESESALYTPMTMSCSTVTTTRFNVHLNDVKLSYAQR